MRRLALVALVSSPLCACQDGTLVLDIADAPTDEATSVVLQISGIDLLPTDGDAERFTFSPPRQVDLLNFTGGDSANLLDGQRVPEGDYAGLRLIVDVDGASQSHIDIANVRQSLVLEGGGDEIVINEPFTIERRKELALTLDIDLRQSVIAPAATGDPYGLEPVTRLIKTEDAATISGTVASNRVPGGCVPVVYAYRGHDVDPDDMGSATDVIASAPVRQGTATGSLGYAIAFLPADDYSVALTCDAVEDDPREDDDNVVFSQPLDVTVGAGETATANFQ